MEYPGDHKVEALVERLQWEAPRLIQLGASEDTRSGNVPCTWEHSEATYAGAVIYYFPS